MTGPTIPITVVGRIGPASRALAKLRRTTQRWGDDMQRQLRTAAQATVAVGGFAQALKVAVRRFVAAREKRR